MRTRFRREAELLASLNHPNIAVIHDIIEPDDRSGYLVLEYVPGETLAERMKRGSLTMNEVLSISQQIAEAISVAHRKGIVHRDLKPGNIKITLEDQVKVLDFGLAKSFVKKQARSEITQTQHGRVIGTPAYMSPEQARGNETDHRTDVWSFGCIMYQMLTAHLPFEGETATDTLARIIEREPDWERLPKNTPTEIRTLLRYCLEKDPNQRLENIANAGIEIGNMLTKPVTSLVETIPKRSRRTTMVMATIGVIVLIGAAMWFGLNKVTESSTKVPRLVVLPFENLGRTEDAYFADAITDEIRTRLISLHELDVISRYSAMQYKNGDKNVRQIGSELRVDHILAGTIRRKQQSNPNRLVRMTLQLVKTSDDTIVWSKTYDIDLPKIFQAQSDVGFGDGHRKV
ncbi:MAG: protein kinase [Sedimentisphaerales bacterium]